MPSEGTIIPEVVVTWYEVRVSAVPTRHRFAVRVESEVNLYEASVILSPHVAVAELKYAL